MFSRFGLLKPNQPRAFNYTPRYYDERKSRLRDLREMAEKADMDPEYKARLIETRLRRSFQRSRPEPSKSYTLRLLLIIVLLVGLVGFLFLDSSDIEQFLN